MKPINLADDLALSWKCPYVDPALSGGRVQEYMIKGDAWSNGRRLRHSVFGS